jgi:hypothetical protein
MWVNTSARVPVKLASALAPTSSALSNAANLFGPFESCDGVDARGGDTQVERQIDVGRPKQIDEAVDTVRRLHHLSVNSITDIEPRDAAWPAESVSPAARPTARRRRRSRR